MGRSLHRGYAALVVMLAGVLLPQPGVAGRAQDVRVLAFRLLNEGVSAYKQGDYPTAVEKLGQSSSMALNSFRAYFYLGLALIGDRRYEQALDALEVALDLDPDHLQAHVASGDAWLKRGDLAEAQASYFRALKLRPEFPPALDGLARVYEARDEIDEAIAHFRRAIASNPGYAEAYTHLGDLLLRSRRFEEAVQLLEEAIAIRPDYAPGLNRLARAYGRLGLDNQAMATIHKAMELEPEAPSHPAILGWLQLLQGYRQTALQWFERALELDPANPEALLGVAELDRRRGDYASALAEVDRALADPRVDPVQRQRIERVRNGLEEESGRVAELDARTESGEATSEEYAELATIHADRADWDRAAELLSRAVDTPDQRPRLAYLLFRAQRFTEALEFYEELARGHPTADHELNVGATLAVLGDDDAAIAAYRRALQLDPDHARARLYLGNALLRQGQRQAAVEAYREFLRESGEGEDAERVRRILDQVAPAAEAGQR